MEFNYLSDSNEYEYINEKNNSEIKLVETNLYEIINDSNELDEIDIKIIKLIVKMEKTCLDDIINYIKKSEDELDIKTFIRKYLITNGTIEFLKLLKDPDNEIINEIYEFEYLIKYKSRSNESTIYKIDEE